MSTLVACRNDCNLDRNMLFCFAVFPVLYFGVGALQKHVRNKVFARLKTDTCPATSAGVKSLVPRR